MAVVTGLFDPEVRAATVILSTGLGKRSGGHRDERVRLRGVLRKPNEREKIIMPTIWATVGWIESSGVLGSKALPVKTRVLLYLIRWGDKSLESWHSKSKIGKALGVSRVHVQNELADLERDGIIERHPDARNGKVRLRKHVLDSHRSGDYIVTAPVTLRRQEEGPSSSNTHSETTEQKRRRIAAEQELKYGKHWKDYVFCRICLENHGAGMRRVGEKWYGDLGRAIPVYECKKCADQVSPTVAGRNGHSGDTGLRPGASQVASLPAGEEEVG